MAEYLAGETGDARENRPLARTALGARRSGEGSGRGLMLGSLSREAFTMPLMGPIPEGKTFFCPHCGALYSVTASRVPKESDIVKCVVCLQTMDAGDAAKLSIYKLVHRPEDA